LRDIIYGQPLVSKRFFFFKPESANDIESPEQSDGRSPVKKNLIKKF